MRVRIRRRNLQGKENIREEGAEAARTGHVGVHCVGHFPLPARAEEGAPGWSLRGFAALFSGRAWHLRVPAWDRGVSGFGGLLEQLGRMKAKKKMEATDAACPPSPPGKWANEKHTLVVFTREFNYPVFRSRLFLFGFGVAFCSCFSINIQAEAF